MLEFHVHKIMQSMTRIFHVVSPHTFQFQNSFLGSVFCFLVVDRSILFTLASLGFVWVLFEHLCLSDVSTNWSFLRRSSVKWCWFLGMGHTFLIVCVSVIVVIEKWTFESYRMVTLKIRFSPSLEVCFKKKCDCCWCLCPGD